MLTNVKTLPLTERPRERCLEQGASCLSLRECLALILTSGPPDLGVLGLAEKILEHFGSDLSLADQEIAFFTAMENSGGAPLQGLRGLGPAGRAKLLAAFELGRRYAIYRHQNESRGKQRGFSDLSQKVLDKVSKSLRCEPQEWLGFVALHRSGKLSDFCPVERGVRTHVNIDPAELFARVLALRPAAFFLIHNHPSGEMTPSGADVDLTWRVKQVGDQLGVCLLGHWIVGPQDERWISVI